MLRRLAGLFGLSLLACAQHANAQFSYAQQQVNIRAGIVVIDSAQTLANKQPINYTPYVWYNLDSDTSVKPAGWNIYNPAATTQLTQAIYNRWSGIAADLGQPVPPLPGARLTKASAPYWEVRLSQVGDTQLASYDVLLLPAYGYTNLSPVERDKLRKFVDQGGTLWIDMDSRTDFVSAGGTQVNTFPIPVQTIGGGGFLTDADIFSPLMTVPYSLSLANLEQFRVDPVAYANRIVLNNLAPSLGGYQPIESWLESDWDIHMEPVSTNATRANILLGSMGDGHVVITTSRYAMALNRIAISPGVYSANDAFFGLGPTFDRTTQLAAKFAVNLISLAGGSPQPANGARHPGSIPTDLHPPLLSQFRADLTSTPPFKGQTPALYRGLYVMSSGNRLFVYDAKPNTDLDGDANPDDGVQDLSLGAGNDLLWASPDMGTPLSAPTCYHVPTSAHPEQIAVQGGNGTVYLFDAFQIAGGLINPGGSLAIAPFATINEGTGVSFDASEPDPGPYAPTFHDGLLYVASVEASTGTGFVWIVDPISQDCVRSAGGDAWEDGTSNPGPSLPEPSGSPTVAYIPIQDNSGGYDRVLYHPGRPTSSISPNGTASLTSLWLGVRGESPPPSSIDPTGTPGMLTVTTRAAGQGCTIYLPNGGFLTNRSLGVKLTVMHPNGDPFSVQETHDLLDGTVQQVGNGVLQFGLKQVYPVDGAGQPYPLRLDYTIDWGNPVAGSKASILRGQLFFPDDYINITTANQRRRIIGNIAMSPRGTIYACVGNPEGKASNTAANLQGGSFYALREDIGRGGFRLLTRYELAPQHSVMLNQAALTTIKETFADSDPVLSMMPGPVQAFMAGRFTRLTFMGAPSVRDGVVYVTASARKNDPFAFFGGVPHTILMAFKAEPETPQIHIGTLPDGWSIRQYDIDRSANHSAPTVPDDMTQGNLTYDRNSGVIKFENMMTSNRGPMLNAFSTSEPVIIRAPNTPDQLVYPDALGNRWSPLLWYVVMHGIECPSGPVTTGSSTFVPGQSVLPNLTDMMAQNRLIFSGMVQAWDTNVAPNDKYLGTPDATRPWLRQLYQIIFTGGNPDGNTHYLWPLMSGVRDFTDYIIRVRQTMLGRPGIPPASTTCYGLAAGEGVLAAYGDQGAYAFSKADFLIADNNRLLRSDAAGNPLWISDVSSSSGTSDTGAVGALKPLLRPVKAYPVGENDVLIAEAGGNRVTRIDLSGRELRSISGFKLDPTNVPEGYQANEPLTLNGPRDVTLWTSYELGGTQYWVHYLIADTGNRRVIELADKYTVNANRQITGVVNVAGSQQIGVLVWHSPANYTGKSFDYNSISRVYEPVSGSYYYVAGIGNSMPTQVDSGLDTAVGGPTSGIRQSSGGNGGVVVFNPRDPSRNIIINQVEVPSIQAGTYWDFTGWPAPTFISGGPGAYNVGGFTSLARGAHNKTLSGVNSVTARVVIEGGQPVVAIMFTDQTGVYEVVPGATGWVVRWMLPNEAYKALRRIDPGVPQAQNPLELRATYARRLDDGDVLVVNGYVGRTRGSFNFGANQWIAPPTDFNGEVLQIAGDFNPDPAQIGFDFGKPNLGFDLRMIVFHLPPITGARGLVLPVFADRR